MAISDTLKELEEFVERFSLSFTNATVQPPTNAEITSALNLLKKIVGDSPRYDEICRAIHQEKVVLSPKLADSMATLVAAAVAVVSADPKKKRLLEYRPNEIPLKKRWNNFLFAAVLLAYGGLGAGIDDLYVPITTRQGVHFHGAPAWTMFGAMVCAASILLLTIIDHYDRRDNEHHYQRMVKGLRTLGWTLFNLTVLLDIYFRFLR